MKFLPIIFSLLFLFSVSVNAQDQSASYSKQIGIAGLPIFYLNNANGNSFNGVALYGNIGWFIKDYNVIGARPFFGTVNLGFQDEQILNSLGSNFYYRRYFNKKRWSFFVDANIGFGYIWYSSEVPSIDVVLKDLNGAMFNYAIGPGVDYEVKNGWNIELTVQYLEMKNITHPEDTNVGKTIIPAIGLQKFF